MNTMTLYLAESTICLSVLFTIYWFFLKRDTFFMLNRCYLLSVLLFSMLFPLLPIRWTPSATPGSLVVLLEPVLITPEKVQESLLHHIRWIEIVAVIYLTGSGVFLLRFVLQLIQLYLIKRRFGVSEIEGERIVFVDRGYSPFSFFNLVFINKAAVPFGSLNTILEHERIHRRQRHTFDMMLLEMATIIQWFNPLIWLTSREIKSIHEYLADEGVLQNGITRSAYQQLILEETMGIRVNNLTNNFNVSLLKKRLAMMTKPKSNLWAKSKVLLALPVLLSLLFMITARSFSNSMEIVIPVKTVLIPEIKMNNPVIQDKSKQQTQVKYVAPVPQDKSVVYKEVEKMPSYPGSEDARIKFMVENITYPEAAKKNNVQGKVFVNFIVRSDGSVTDVKILRGIGSGCDEEAMRVVKMMPKWNPGEQKGKPVDVSFVLPIQFKLDNHKTGETKK